MKIQKKFVFDNRLYDMFEELITYSTTEGKIIGCNKAFCEYINKSRRDTLTQNEYELLCLSRISKENEEKLFKKNSVRYEEKNEQLKDKRSSFLTKKRIVYEKKSAQPNILTIRKDITKKNDNFIIYKEYKKLLKHISSGTTLGSILDKLVRSVEKKNPDMICSVLILDRSGKRLFSGASNRLPERYIEKINGMEVGEKVGSCGAAVFCKKRVVVEDISKHENWRLAKNLASRNNLHACWSQPIFDSKGEVLGTFAIYYEQPKKPTKFDLSLIEDLASIAGIAIEKHKNEYKISKNYENEQRQERLLMHKSKQAMMGEMLENIAHQWRQPLSVISTSATGVQLKRQLNQSKFEEEEDALETININAQYLSQTIEDFRSYFKSDNKVVKFNIKDALGHTLKLVNARLCNENVHMIEKTCDIENVTLENELIQVLMNILNNAIDELANIPQDQRYILVKMYQEKERSVIKIVDSAGGINDNILPRIFEPYFTTKHQSQGTGIGLYMCKEIIEKHIEGTIDAKNNSFKYEGKLYKGLEFIITIPNN